jgi:hypothetical protein
MGFTQLQIMHDSEVASNPMFDASKNADTQHQVEFGGADRDRTGGLLVANQALSQLSYSPTDNWWAWVELNYRPHPYQGCALAT